VPFPRVKDLQPRHFAQVLERIKGKSYDTLVETVLLRSMARAAYQPDNLGHFGLALAHYVHFTSPIRRYPDLLVHRAIKHALAGKTSGSFPYSPKEMDRLGQHCSMTERRADDATRDAIAWLKCEFMLDKIGEEFDGVITGVTSFGVFVQLRDVFVEGLVHVTSLENDYYEFDAPRHRLVGARSKKVYQLAAPLRADRLRAGGAKGAITGEAGSRQGSGQAGPRATAHRSAKGAAKLARSPSRPRNRLIRKGSSRSRRVSRALRVAPGVRSPARRAAPPGPSPAGQEADRESRISCKS
jgi:ribonuclease R